MKSETHAVVIMSFGERKIGDVISDPAEVSRLRRERPAFITPFKVKTPGKPVVASVNATPVQVQADAASENKIENKDSNQ